MSFFSQFRWRILNQFQLAYFSESQSIDIAYLNDDVFYGIFAYLDLDDLENIINLNERLVPIVRYTFSKKYESKFSCAG